jgi:regulatory protein
MDQTLYESLMRAAYRFISYRSRSEKELRDFLEKKLKTWNVAGQASVEKTIERLRDLGYVDDKKFALWWIEQRSAFRPKGARVLKFELQKKGVSREVIETCLLAGVDDQSSFDELASAKKAIHKKIVIWGQLPIIEQKKKMYTFLAQRGFSSEVITRIIDEITKKSYN